MHGHVAQSLERFTSAFQACTQRDGICFFGWFGMYNMVTEAPLGPLQRIWRVYTQEPRK